MLQISATYKVGMIPFYPKKAPPPPQTHTNHLPKTRACLDFWGQDSGSPTYLFYSRRSSETRNLHEHVGLGRCSQKGYRVSLLVRRLWFVFLCILDQGKCTALNTSDQPRSNSGKLCLIIYSIVLLATLNLTLNHLHSFVGCSIHISGP